MPSGTPDDWAGNPSSWRQVGVALMAKAPDFVRSGSGYDKLRYLYGEYCKLLTQHNVPLNGSLGTRATVSLTKWACGNHSVNLENLFLGSGVSPLKAVFLRGAPAGWIDSILKGVNWDHGALGVAIDGVVLVFDPWIPAYLTNRTYANEMQLDFGGIPYPLWEMVMRDQGYDTFQAGQETWQPSIRLALEAANLSSSTEATPPKPTRAMVAGHWRLVSITPMPYTVGDPSSAVGAIYGTSWFWWHSGEPDGDNLSRARVFTSMSPHAAVLIPNTQLSVSTSIFEAYPSPLKCGPTNAHYTWQHVDSSGQRIATGPIDDALFLGRVDRENQTWRQSTSFQIPIPAGAPGQGFSIFVVTPPGSIRYAYGWSAGGTAIPEGEAAQTFTGRWETAWGVIELRQRGPSVEGSYPHDGGKIKGTLSADGRTLTGTWSEAPTYKPPQDGGDLEFVLSEDGKSFEGRYWYGSRPEGDPGAEWNGRRIG